MSEKTELWLIRHGETEWSLSGKHTSRTDISLTEHGRRRARETCAIAGFGDVAVVDEGLREWDYGVYEGKTTAEIRKEVPGWSVWKDEIVGGETVEHVGERADDVISRALAAGASGGAVALFAHAHILRILAARWIGLEADGCGLLAFG